jgi:hypothetical protein
MIVLLKNVKPIYLASTLVFRMMSELTRTNKLHAVNILLENITYSQLVKKFPAFYGT